MINMKKKKLIAIVSSVERILVVINDKNLDPGKISIELYSSFVLYSELIMRG